MKTSMTTFFVFIFMVGNQAWAQEKSLSYEKSLSTNTDDVIKEDIWAPGEINKVEDLRDTSEKDLSGLPEPSIHEYTLAEGTRKLVLSQKWDAACGDTLCETRAVEIEPDGTKKVLTTDMMPQFPLEKMADGFKSLTAEPFVSLSADGKSLNFRTTQVGQPYVVPLD